MKRLTILGLVILAAVAIADDTAESEGLSLAERCDPETCKLPDCRCASTDSPNGLRARDVPQFVTVTFDDGVNIVNIESYRETLYGRRNPNQCHIGATFYVSHEYTNYQLVNELYQRGFEIGLHSISHRTPQTWWATASYDELRQEFIDQRRQISHFANIPQSAVQGLRKPFLQLSGNTTFQLLKENNMLYDCSWPTTNFNNPPLWPYTLDYASVQDCHIGPCPTASFPGLWVQPMVSWIDLEGFPCSMTDACINTPDRESDVEGWYRFFVQNFERHYLGNRAPFPFYMHEGFISVGNPVIRTAFIRFLNLLNNLPDVFLVNSAEVVEWMKNPVPVDEYMGKPCRQFTNSPCTPRNCGSYEHGTTTYWFSACSVCPNVYPWVGNPLGE